MLCEEEHIYLLGALRHRALQAVHRMRRESQQKRDLQHMISALQEVTGMDSAELQAIADRVQREVASESDRFFSVRSQIFSVAGLVVSAASFAWLTAILI